MQGNNDKNAKRLLWVLERPKFPTGLVLVLVVILLAIGVVLWNLFDSGFSFSEFSFSEFSFSDVFSGFSLEKIFNLLFS